MSFGITGLLCSMRVSNRDLFCCVFLSTHDVRRYSVTLPVRMFLQLCRVQLLSTTTGTLLKTNPEICSTKLSADDAFSTGPLCMVLYLHHYHSVEPRWTEPSCCITMGAPCQTSVLSQTMSTDLSRNEATLTLHILVIAHPDDESMFFVPCLKYLKSLPLSSVWVLCLTTGNYDGLGILRSSELRKACAAELLSIDRVILLDGPGASLQDHPTNAWNIELTAEIIRKTLEAALTDENLQGVTNLNFITFDEFGVSGHVNHRDTYLAVRHVYWKQLQQQLLTGNNNNINRLARTVTAWSLETVRNPLNKYVPVWEWIRLVLCWCGWVSAVSSSISTTYSKNNHHRWRRHSGEITYRCLQPSLNWKAMAAHRSQFVWYRRLFVVFSCYTYVNRLRRMDVPSSPTAGRPKQN